MRERLDAHDPPSWHYPACWSLDVRRTLRRNLSVPVSTKIRLLDSPAETVEFARRMEKAGACALSVHMRYPRASESPGMVEGSRKSLNLRRIQDVGELSRWFSRRSCEALCRRQESRLSEPYRKRLRTCHGSNFVSSYNQGSVFVSFAPLCSCS